MKKLLFILIFGVFAILLNAATIQPFAVPNLNAGISNSSAINSVKELSYNGFPNSELDFRSNPKPDYQGQLGISFTGDNDAALFVGFTNSIGNYWWAPISFYGGLYRIGHPYLMRSNTFHTVEMYFNGSAFQQRQVNGPTSDGSDLYIYQMNPWSDFAGICVPMIATNVVGTVISTNADGIKIYLVNPFGAQWGTISPQNPVGETSQAGSYIGLVQGDFPFYLAANTTIPNETVAGYSQKTYFGANPLSTGTRAHTFSIPMWIPYAWHMTNALWRDIVGGDFYTGSGWAGSNWYVGGTLQVTQQNAGQSVLGPYYPNAANPNCTWFISTNCAIGPGTDVANVLGLGDYTAPGGNRLGVTKQQGAFAKFSYSSGAPFTIAQSSAADLFSSPASQTLTDRLVIDSSGNLRGLSPSNYFANVVSVAAGGLQYGTCPINTNFLASSAGTVYTLTASYALLDFGTTDPAVTIQNTGNYLITGKANFVSRGATYAATNTYSIKLRKTSGTPADLAGSEAVQTIPIITTTTEDLGIIDTRPVIFSATAGDVVQLWGVVSATPSVGNVICDRADVVAIRLY